MSEWIDGANITIAGLDKAGNTVSNMLEAHVSYLGTRNGPAPKVGEAIECRITVTLQQPWNFGHSLTLGLFLPSNLQPLKTGTQCVLDTTDVTSNTFYDCSVSHLGQPTLSNGAINLGLRYIDCTYGSHHFTFNFWISSSSFLIGNETITAYIKSASATDAATTSVSLQAIPDESRGRIAYGEFMEQAPIIQIKTMNIDGGDVSVLTDGSDAYAGSPVWSPNGSEIAFCSYRDGFAQPYLMKADGSGQRRLTSSGPLSSLTCGVPKWSADGKLMVLQAVNKSGGYWEIWKMNADGSNQQKFIGNDNHHYTYPVWVADRRVVCLVNSKEMFGANWDETEAGTIHLADTSFTRMSLASHPLHQTLVYAAVEDPSKPRIFLYDDTNGERDLCAGDSPTFSWSGRQVIFRRRTDLYIISLSGENETLIARGFWTGDMDCSKPWQ